MLMRSYFVATQAYSQCLQSHVHLGAVLVAASDKLLDDQTAVSMKIRLAEVRRIISLMRRTKTQLKNLARRLKTARAQA